MGILDSFFANSESTGKGFGFFSNGKSYLVAYGAEGEIVAYTTGISVGDKIMDKYLESRGLDESNVVVQEEFHKGKDGFIAENQGRQICIVDKKLMLKEEVMKLMESSELVADRTNKWMNGLDKYTTSE